MPADGRLKLKNNKIKLLLSYLNDEVISVDSVNDRWTDVHCTRSILLAKDFLTTSINFD